LTAMARAWETLSVNVGKVDWNNGRPKIIVNRTQLAALPSMFAVYQSGETSVKVRAGIAARWDGRGEAHVVQMTVDGDGTSWDTSDVKTLEGITSSQWINLSLDEDEDPRDPLDPATLTAEKTGSTTETDGEDGLEIPIAYVECEEGKITRIVQAHSGPWYLPVAGGRSVQEIIEIIETYIEEEVVIVTSWDGLNDTSGTPGHSLTHGYIPVSDENTGSLDLKEPSEAGLPFWIQDSDYEDCYGSSIGNSAQELVIDLDNETLESSFTAKIDFTVENDLTVENVLTVENELFADVIKDLDEDMLTIDLGAGTLTGASMQVDLNGGLVESPELALRGTTSLDLQYGATGVRFGPEDENPSTFPGATAMEVVLQASPTSPPQRVRILGAVLGPV
jgi:hypothetical protein